ncbi:MAG: protein containing prepilin-type N- cleavage/methylation domain protein, partial [Epsilonproteobacteria bacterium]|nr:protein containing prepilin-type N- cleavage/methylation domain protein [Campylobacterota bacterium]
YFVKFEALASSKLDKNATVLEWIGSDVEGFRGNDSPLWSGIIDLDLSTFNVLKTPETNTTALNEQIKILSLGGSDINDSAIFFIGSTSNINNYGWDGVKLTKQTEQNSSIHPINSGANPDEFVTGIAGVDFNSTDVYEYYQLAWSAYAVEHNTTSGDLWLHYDYQPWNGDTYLTKDDGSATKKALIMKNVDTFRFKAVGSVVKVQVCVKSDVMEDYSLCKEKTIF